MSANWEDCKVTFEVTMKFTTTKVSDKKSIRFSAVEVTKGAEVEGLGIFTPKLKYGNLYFLAEAEEPKAAEVPEELQNMTPEELQALAAFIQGQRKPARRVTKKKTASKKS